MIRVRLTYADEVLSHETGFLRAKEIASTAEHSSRYDRDLNYHEYIGQLSEAVGSEIAVAKYFNLADFKPTHSTFKQAADIGQRIEVKWTKWKDGHLVVHQSDRDSDIAVLVVGRSPEYFLAGWIPVNAAKIKRFWRHSEQNWWISQSNLRPMEDFIRSIHYATAF